MGLDIKLLRDNPELLRETLEKRYKDPKIIDELKGLYTSQKDLLFKLTVLNAELNKLKKDMTQKKKRGESIEDNIREKNRLDILIQQTKEDEIKYKNKLYSEFSKIGNILHDTVPISNNEDDNVVIRTFGETDTKKYNHIELIEKLGIADTKRGVKVVGNRGYFLKNFGVKLNQALINYSISFLEEKGYDLLQTPFMMNHDQMSATAQLEQFDEELYKIATNDGAPDNCKYLIATSEQPISAYHSGETIYKKDLPIKYCGISTCFRKEAGQNRDVKGIFRVHQFEKVEQFILTEEDKSWEMHERLLEICEQFYQSLGIPYRVVNIVSGALNNAAAKKYDLEGWFPGLGKYRELVSCSNCTDYQSRNLNVRYMSGTYKFVHMLNCTLCATTRTMCAIIENNQVEGGIRVPHVLQEYVGTEFILYE